MYGSITVTNNPEGPMAFWLSIIPFTSPVAMIARIPFGVPAWQIVLSTALLIGATFLMVFIASKVYKVGILMYGNKATLKELWKWIKNWSCFFIPLIMLIVQGIYRTDFTDFHRSIVKNEHDRKCVFCRYLFYDGQKLRWSVRKINCRNIFFFPQIAQISQISQINCEKWSW